jgi:pimeloyl-ACP methyl ester carboxylesterase
MRQGEYLDLPMPGGAIQPFAERLRAFHRTANREGFADKLLADLDETDNVAFGEFCQASTAAIKDAPAAAGPFPLVMYHAGFGGIATDNTVLFEWLASHGYVVVNSAYQPEGAAWLGIDADFDRSRKDMTFLVHHLQNRPNVDVGRVAAMGHSYGAQAAFAWAASPNSAVAVVVSLDTTLERCPLDQEEVKVEGGISVNMSLREMRTSFERERRLSTPALIFTRALGSPGIGPASPPSFALYEKMPCADRYYVETNFLGHNDYCSLLALGHLSRRRQSIGVADAGQRWQVYEAVCRLILLFLDGHLGGNQEALTRLQTTTETPPAGSVDGQALLSLRYCQASPPPLTEKQFLDMIDKRGVETTREFFRHSQDQFPRQSLEEMTWTLRGHEETEAVVLLLELAVERFPESAALHERLGEAYLASGATRRASVTLRKALDLIPEDLT